MLTMYSLRQLSATLVSGVEYSTTQSLNHQWQQMLPPSCKEYTEHNTRDIISMSVVSEWFPPQASESKMT